MNRAYKIIMDVLKEQFGYLFIGENQEDFMLSDYLNDSIMFIQFIVSLEETLGLELPDDFLNPELLDSINGFADKLDFFLSQSRNG